MALQKLKVGRYKGPWGKVATKHDALVEWLAGAQGKGGIIIRPTDGALMIGFNPVSPVADGPGSGSSGGGANNFPIPVDVPNGGTGLTTVTTNGVLIGQGTNAMAVIGNYTFTGCVNGSPKSFDVPVIRGPY